MNLASCGTNQGSGDFHFLPQMEILRMDHHLLEGILLRPSYRRRGDFLRGAGQETQRSNHYVSL